MSKVVNAELGKKFKFDHKRLWYMHNPHSGMERRRTKFSGTLSKDGSTNLGQNTRPRDSQQKENL